MPPAKWNFAALQHDAIRTEEPNTILTKAPYNPIAVSTHYNIVVSIFFSIIPIHLNFAAFQSNVSSRRYSEELKFVKRFVPERLKKLMRNSNRVI